MRPDRFRNRRPVRSKMSRVKRQPVELAPPIGQVREKYRDISVGIRVRIATRPRAKQDQPLDAIAIDREERRADAP